MQFFNRLFSPLAGWLVNRRYWKQGEWGHGFHPLLPPFPSLPQSDAPPGDLWPLLWEGDVFRSPRSGFELGQSRAPLVSGARHCVSQRMSHPSTQKVQAPTGPQTGCLSRAQVLAKGAPSVPVQRDPGQWSKPQMGRGLYNSHTPPRDRE